MILPLRALWFAAHGAFRALGFRSRLLRVGDRTLHVYDRVGKGTAPPVLLVHGMGGNAAGFVYIARALLRASRRVVALELPGHGRSRLLRGEAPATIVESGQAVAAALSDLGEPAVMIGSSLGGALSLFTAAAQPQNVVAVVGLNPAGAPLEGADREAVLEAFRGGSARAALETHRKLYRKPPRMSWLFARGIGKHWASPPVQQFASEIRAGYQGLGKDLLSSVRQPVLILWGEDDRILPGASVDYFRTHLPHAAVEVVPRAGHLPMMEQPRLVAARIARFLGELA
jgi:pimeloyl-ACP methyl ester carboxylesterase